MTKPAAVKTAIKSFSDQTVQTAGVIGTGRIAWSLEKDKLRYKPCTHLGAILALAGKAKIKQIWLCDIDAKKANEAARWIQNQQPGITVRLFENEKQLIEAHPDLLVIASDTDTHFQMVKTACKAKIPKIVLEKPAIINRAEANRLRRLNDKSDSKIWINYERRYRPKYLRLKKAVLSQKPWGAPLYYRGWLASPHQDLSPGPSGEGVLLRDTTHLLDLAIFLFGPVKSHQKEKAPKQSKTNLIQITHFNQVSGELLTTAGSEFFHFELEIIFQKGRVNIGNGFMKVEKSVRSSHYTSFYSLNRTQETTDKKMVFNDNPFIRLYKEVILGKNDPQGIKDGCENVKILS